MDSIEAWICWFEANFPTKVSADARSKYSSLLIENEIFDLETFSECIELEPDFLSAKINVKNISLQNSIKKLVQSEINSSNNSSPLPTQLHTALSSTSLVDFEPVTNIGSDLSPAYWKIDNVTKLPYSSANRFIYSGSFTVANVTREVFIKRQLIDSPGVNDLEHEAAVYKAIKFNASLIELLYFHPQVPNSYLVLERFGRNLNAFLHNKCAIRLQILEELGVALNALHGAGFVHCDIKPQNILVDSREGTVHLKLCDLDSAERIGELFQHVGAALKYTEQWVSPEVYFGRGGELRVSPAIDVFSYGLIAAVLFDDAISENKTILPRKSDNEALFTQCLTDQAVLNSQMPCQRGKRYQDLVHRMCDLNPAHRATLRDVDLALGLSRATAIHAHNAVLSQNNDFLKHEIVEKQAEIITHLADIKQSLAELGAKLNQLLENDVELKNMLGTVLSGSFDCPTLFIYVPVAANKTVWSRVKDPLSFVQDRFKLFFMCAHTMEMVPCGPNGDGYPVTCNKAWLVKAAPYIKVGLILLKEVLAVYHLPLPIANTLNMLSSDVNLHSKFIDGALNYVTSSCRADALDKAASQFDNVIACLDSTDRVSEMKSVDRSPSAAKEAYNSVRSVLTSHNYWSDVSSTCGLVSVSHKGFSAWIKADKAVQAQFIAQCEEKIRAGADVALPTPPVKASTSAKAAPPAPPATASPASSITTTATTSATTNKASTSSKVVTDSLFDDDDDDANLFTSPARPARNFDSLFDEEGDDSEKVPFTAPPEWRNVPGGAYATDEEVHSLSLKCRLADSEAEAARLTGLAKTGNWYAEVCYAILQEDGAPHIPKNAEEALAFRAKGPSGVLKVTAKIDNKYAQYALGWYYVNEGPHFDDEEGVKLYRLAAEQGLDVAQRGLGWWFENGQHGLPVDKKEAVRWYQLSSDAGFAAAQYHLARCYMNGAGVEKDRVEGVRLYKLAAKQGNAKAQYQVGRAYAKGLGELSKNNTKAVKFYEQAAAQRHETSIYELALCYANNTEGIKKKDLMPTVRLETMAKLFRQAADLGHYESMVRLGKCYYNGEGVKKNLVKADKWFRKAATEGEHTEARYHLGVCCLDLSGFGDDTPAQEGVEWFKLAAKDSYDPAYYKLGHCYQHGVGVEQDHVEAERWYNLKCESDSGAGSNDARERIKEIHKAAKGSSGKGGLFGFGLFKK